jgi:hypothetical protein
MPPLGTRTRRWAPEHRDDQPAPEPAPATLEDVLAVLHQILAALTSGKHGITPEDWQPQNEDGTVNWLVPDVEGYLGHDVMAGTQPGGKIKTFVRSRDRVAAEQDD